MTVEAQPDATTQSAGFDRSGTDKNVRFFATDGSVFFGN